MAEVYFNFYNKNTKYEAVSAWTCIKWDWKINPKVIFLLKSKWIDIFKQEKEYFPKNIDYNILEKAKKIYTMWCMEWWCLIWDKKVDFDFWLEDPANSETNIEKMWEIFKAKMEVILREFN